VKQVIVAHFRIRCDVRYRGTFYDKLCSKWSWHILG